MDRKPKVSVILPSLNVAKYIRQCVKSVVDQTLKDIEIICVDAGSTDGTLEVLREFEAKDDRVKVIVSDKKSYGYQMNLGLDAATGEYFGIVETDDWVVPEMFRELYDCAKKNDLDFVKADFYRFTENEDGSLNKKYYQLSSDESFYDRVLTPGNETQTFHFVMNTWSGIYSIDFLRKWNIRHNETPGASYQDNGFWFQTFCRAERAFFIHKPYYMNRRDNENSSVFSKGKVYCMRDEYDYIRSIIEGDRKRLEKFIPLCNYYRFCGYYHNTVFRIAPEYQREFVEFFSNEFRALADACELEKSEFGNKEWSALMQIMYAPERFLAERLAPEIKLTEKDYQYRPDEEGAPLISVIVPVYNVEKYLKTCLDSLLAQTMKDFEVICVNDGSTDGSLAILNEYAEKDGRICVVDKENGGPSSARNVGLSNARGKYICFVDSDDGMAKNALSIAAGKAVKAKSDICVFGFETKRLSVEGEMPKWLKNKTPVRNIVFDEFEPAALFKEPGGKPFIWGKLFRRAYLREMGLFFSDDFSLGEDNIFLFCAFPKAKNICFIKDKLYHYRYDRQDSLMKEHNRDQFKKCQCHIQIVSNLCDRWKHDAILNKMQQEFANWAIDFVYNEFDSLAEKDKPACADQFLKVLPAFCSDEKNLLGFGKQERVIEMREWAAMHSVEQCKCDENAFRAHDSVEAPKVSFVVPVHNMEKFVERTLLSLLGQSEPEIEIICVDDASEDGTLEKLRSIAQIDQRLRIISYSENKTASQARKDGVLAARGKYILFCDADDTFAANSCETLLAEMERRPVDILHFGTNVINNGGAEEDKAWLDANLRPFDGSLKGKDVFEGCFRGGLYGRNLWNKMYSAELAKKAFSRVKDGRFPRGQDIYAYFLLAYFAESYQGISSVSLYNYNLGLGMDGTKKLTPAQFESFCSFPLVVEALREFLEEEGAFEDYQDIWITLRSNMVGDCVNKWYNKVADEDKGQCLDLMLELWPKWLVVESVARRYWNDPGRAMRSISGSKLRSIVKTEPKVIATYYHKMTVGGVERVMESLIRIWTSMGYRVVVLTDIQGPSDECELPEGTVRYAIPNEGVGKPSSYYLRTIRIQEIIQKENVDLCVYHAWNTAVMPWDMLAFKSSGCPFIIHCHSVFSIRLRENGQYFASMPGVFGFADGIVTLSDADKSYWRHFNTNTHTLINPFKADIRKSVCSDLKGKNILWVGRLSPEKRPEEALRVFAQILQSEPDAFLCIVGSSDSEEYENGLRELAEELKIDESIEWCGFHDDVDPFYEGASLLLVTSEFEGFGIAMLEAMSHGLPIVMYEIPHLTLVKNNEGIVSVKQGQTMAAAREVIDILQNEKRRLQLGEASRQFALNIAEYDYEASWEEVFDSLGCERSEPNMDEAERIMWDTLFNDYSYGAQNSASTIAYLKGQVTKAKKKSKKEVEKIKRSKSYKIGRAVTWPFRKIWAVLK